MGTPNFAVPSLDLLCQEDYGVALVVTQPDRQTGSLSGEGKSIGVRSRSLAARNTQER